MSPTQNYVLYRLVATTEECVGYVVNVVVWDGKDKLSVPDGLAIVADPAGQYPIGSTYPATSA